MTHQMVLLIPSYGLYAVCLFLLTAAACFLTSRIYPQFRFNWKLPLIISLTLTAYSVISLSVGLYQSRLILGQSGSQKMSNADLAVLRDQFLRMLKDVSQTPEKLTPEAKKDILKKFDELFSGSDEKGRDLVKKSLIQMADCHVYFWEDAMASFKSKTKIKSDSLLQCAQASGEFFGRDKLFTESDLKSDDQMLSELAAHEQIKMSDGRLVSPSEAILRLNLDVKMKTAQGMRRIFE